MLFQYTPEPQPQLHIFTLYAKQLGVNIELVICNLPPENESIAPVHSVASGKGATHLTIIRSPHLPKIDYHYTHSNTSIQR